MKPEMKEIVINIETPDGKLPQARVRIPDIPMRLANIVLPMHQLCSGIVELAIRREERLGSTISCQMGCGTCCRQLVPLSAPEAFFLWDYLQSLPAEQHNLLEEKFAAIRDAMESSGLTERLMNLEDTNEHRDVAWDYYQLEMPCPFLENESCSIYKYRPFSCREYCVISPAELCVDPFNNPIKKVNIPRNMTTATAMLASELYDIPPMLIPMGFFSEWVKKNKALENQTWQSVWLFNRMLEYATGTDLDDES